MISKSIKSAQARKRSYHELSSKPGVWGIQGERGLATEATFPLVKLLNKIITMIGM